MRKINFTVTFPISLSLDVKEDASDEEILVRILQSAYALDPSEHDGMVIQEVIDSKENNANIIHRILDVQDRLEQEEEYFLRSEEERMNNNYYLQQEDEIDNLF